MDVSVVQPRTFCTFLQIKKGDTFYINDEYYIKCSYDSEEHFYALCLKTGELFQMSNLVRVEPVELMVVLKD